MLSIIVPVYNVEKYLKECFDSLLKQPIDEYEVIVVNDGSTDGSQAIIDQYVKEFPTIFRSLMKENGGLSDARNFGVPYAKGEYITFLDSDDYVSEQLYTHMYLEGKLNDADIVVGDIIFFWENSDKTQTMMGLREGTTSIQKRALLSPMFAWNKIYRKSFYLENNFQYPLNTWYEDLPVTTRMFLTTDKIISCSRGCHYYYRQRQGSIMANTSSERLYEIFSIMEEVYTVATNLGKLEEFHAEIEYLFIEHLLLYGQFRFLRSNDYKNLCTHAFSMVKTYFPNWRKNIYLADLSKKDKLFVTTNNELTMLLYRLYLKGK